MLAYRLKCIILSHPAPFRFLFAILRWFRPVAKVLPGVFVVATSSDVR